jgi:hypothetical protein
MVKYYIYHIPTFKWKDGSIGKIGCTEDPNKRIVKQQGYTDYEIIEEHTDIELASNREIELQKQYGYKVDRILYYKAAYKSKGSKGGNVMVETKKINEVQKIGASLGGKAQGKVNADNGHMQLIQKIGASLGGKKQGKIRGKQSVESGHLAKIASLGGKAACEKVYTCPVCNKVGKSPVMFRYHFDNCKHKKRE